MDHSETKQTEWQSCPPGTLSEFAGQHRRLERRRFLMKSGTIAGGLLLAARAGILAFREKSPHEYDFGGITCTEVRAKAPLLMSGSLDEDVARKIEIHLSKCPNCPEYMDKMMKQMKRDARIGSPQNERIACQCGDSRRTDLTHTGLSEETADLLIALGRIPHDFV